MSRINEAIRQPMVMAVLGGLVLVLILPLFVPSFWLVVLITAYFYAILASSWALLAGYGGQFSFAHMAFMAIGAYVGGLVSIHLSIPLILSIVIGTLAAGLAGLIIGVLVLRFKAAYLALFTIAFSEILRTVLRAEAQITRGDRGLKLEPLFPNSISRVPDYYVLAGLLIAGLIFMYWLERSRIGLFLRAIREDEDAAAARGVDVVYYKVLVFVVTSMIAGLAGAIFANYVTIITPNIMVLKEMGLVIAMAIIGGVESLIAAAIGAILIQISLELLRGFGHWRMVIFGALLIVTLRFASDGLLTAVFKRVFKLGPKAELRQGTVEGTTADGT
jgi:branched-chain amino acid transport system permease protein